MKTKIMIIALAMALTIVFTGCAMNPGDVPDQAAGRPDAGLETAHKLTVSAVGNVKVMPDVAYVTVGIKTQDAQMKKAQNDNKNLMNKLFDVLKRKGLTEDDMRTTNYSAYPMYDYSDGQDIITGYEVTNMVQLTITDIDEVGEYIDIAAENGANTAYPINFSLLDETVYYNDALTDALTKAKGKADTIAQAGGYRILGTLEIIEGSYGYVPYRGDYAVMAEEAAYDGGTTPITAGELDVTANITVVYQID